MKNEKWKTKKEKREKNKTSIFNMPIDTCIFVKEFLFFVVFWCFLFVWFCYSFVKKLVMLLFFFCWFYFFSWYDMYFFFYNDRYLLFNSINFETTWIYVWLPLDLNWIIWTIKLLFQKLNLAFQLKLNQCFYW